MTDVPNTTCTRCRRDLRTLVAQSCAICGLGPLEADLSPSGAEVAVPPVKVVKAAKKAAPAAQGTPSGK